MEVEDWPIFHHSSAFVYIILKAAKTGRPGGNEATTLSGLSRQRDGLA